MMNAPIAQPVATDYRYLKDGDTLRAPIRDIDPVPWGNIRKERDPQEFMELRKAIKAANGVTQGVTVRIDPNDPTRLQLLAGYGRVDASDLEGFLDVPAVFKEADDKLAELIMLQENLVRENLPISDEILAAQRFISYFDGDYDAAASELNWSIKKLRGRLTLNQCSETVLDALRKDKISIGHAEILCAFVPDLQDGTLKKIISENWTIEYLKERAGKANRWLKNAYFDISGCSQCPHNSDVQAELFDNTVGKAKCNNLPCFKEKTNEALAVKKSKLEEEHRIVLLDIEKPDSDRNTVSEEIVGKEQFTSGCTGCESKAVILKDGINRDAGTVIPDQCIDKECFRKMKATFDGATKEKAVPKSTKAKSGTSASKKGSKTTPKPAKRTTATQKTPAGVIENNNETLRTLSATHFQSNAHFREALSVASLIQQSGFAIETSRFKSIVSEGLSSTFNDRVMELYALPVEKLDAIKHACYSAYLTDSKAASSDPRSLMITALAGDEKGKAIAVSGWVPTKDILNAYLKQGLISIAKTSGFEKHYDSLNDKGSFAKVTKKPKGDLIEEILNTTFDWSEYAPDDYIKCLK